MRRPTPVVWLLLRTQRTVRTLRQELSDERVRTVILEGLLGRAERQRDQALRERDQALSGRDQALRDAETVALMAKDRKVALEFLRDQHRIEQLPEVS